MEEAQLGPGSHEGRVHGLEEGGRIHGHELARGGGGGREGEGGGGAMGLDDT